MAVVRRSGERPLSRRAGVLTRHSFSFGEHYDPEHTGVGPLVALNEELMEPGAGYPQHRHSGVDVVSWVAGGRVAHADAVSGSRTVPAGCVAVLRSGPGVVHEEGCAAGSDGPARLLQSWLVAGRAGEPAYEVADLGSRLREGRFVLAAAGPGAGRGEGGAPPLTLSVAGAALFVARVPPTGRVALPAGGSGWLHVVDGEVAVPGAEPVLLGAGDGVAAGADGPGRGAEVAAGPTGAELLLWQLPPVG